MDDYSSELFVFSSDDVLSTIDNYTHQRPKRQHQGSWWDLPKNFTPAATAAVPVKQRTLARNFDSGVWMGSDSSFGEDAFQDIIGPCSSIGEDTKRRKILKIEDDMIRRFDTRAAGFSDVQWEALKQVDHAVLKSNSIIDLSRLFLESLPWAILQPLETFTSEPNQFFEPLEPNLSIFLAQNGLSSLPEELFHLKGLTTLSLRNNKLTELSPAIGQLISSLAELNLSFNRLNYLPMEIKCGFDKVSGLSVLRLTDNPFYQPIQGTKEDTSADVVEIERRFESPQMPKGSQTPDEPHSTHCSRIAYMNILGQSTNGPVPSKDREASPMTNFEVKKLPQATSKVPSLYEIAMRKSAEHPIAELLQSLGNDVPQTLISNLQNAAEQAKTGFQSCSICKRKFSLARTEWIEWESNLDCYKNIPLLYRGCSWSCLPEVGHLDNDAKHCGWTVGSGLKEWNPFG